MRRYRLLSLTPSFISASSPLTPILNLILPLLILEEKEGPDTPLLKERGRG